MMIILVGFDRICPSDGAQAVGAGKTAPSFTDKAAHSVPE